MMKNKLLASIALLSACSSFNVFASCTVEQQAPSDKPDNFNTNEHLSKFDQYGQTIFLVPSLANGLDKTFVKASIMAASFAPGQKYDIKNNPIYISGSDRPDEFGNWFYGAAAQQMGYTLDEALTAAAVVQQWQNYDRDSHPDAGDVSKLAGGIYDALVAGDGSGDNSDVSVNDSADISGGYSYSEDVYESDSNSSNNEDSCDQDNSSSNSSSGGSSGGYGGGWGGISFIGVGGCYGNCSVPTGSVTITDIVIATDPN